MKKNTRIIFTTFSILLITSILHKNLSILKLDFYREHFLNKNNIQDITKNFILTEINIGNPPQKILINIEFFSTGLFIINNNRSNETSEICNYIYPNNIYFNPNISRSLIFVKEKDSDKMLGINFDYKRNIESIRVIDEIYFSNELKMNTSFFLSHHIDNLPFGSGILGLDLNNRYFYNWEFKDILDQIIRNNISNEDNFLITFNNNDEKGSLYIGVPSGENIKNEDILKLLQLNHGNVKENYIEYPVNSYKWQIVINKIQFSPEYIIQDNIHLKFELNTNIIEGSIKYMEFINQAFFNKYNLFSNNICHIKKYELSSYKFI